MSSRTLAEWLSYLEQLHPNAIDMGLDRCREVAGRLGLERPAKRVITVSGTNGKGSTCAFLAALLRGQSLSVGVYSSPHLLRYNERVRINDAEATDAQLCEAFEAVERARGGTTLTYFEMGTLAALWLFQRASLDTVVLEVGLGGRLDAVNIVDANVALISSIGLDHAEWLGTTRESVAGEKAGIFRPGQAAVCGDPEPPKVLGECAREIGAALRYRGSDYDLVIGRDSWMWRGTDVANRALEIRGLPLLQLPMENAALAIQAFALLGFECDAASVAQALVDTRIPGRLEQHELKRDGRCITLLLDVGHNPQAASYLASRLKTRPLSGQRVAVFGLLADKDLEGVVGPLVSVFDRWLVAPLATARTRPAEALQSVLLAEGADATVQPSVQAALDSLERDARDGDEIVVFGSFYCVAEALDWLARDKK
ncbi:bifunctional tetrahydrofolate synthase/dihydrofolate synthase [Pseudomonas sp. Marseille-QA0892]